MYLLQPHAGQTVWVTQILISKAAYLGKPLGEADRDTLYSCSGSSLKIDLILNIYIERAEVFLSMKSAVGLKRVGIRLVLFCGFSARSVNSLELLEI